MRHRVSVIFTALICESFVALTPALTPALTSFLINHLLHRGGIGRGPCGGQIFVINIIIIAAIITPAINKILFIRIFLIMSISK